MNFKNKFFITVFLFLILGTKSVFAFSGSGTGTDVDPYQITTCAQLQEIADADINEVNYYTLAQDIDCSDTVSWNGGLGFEPIGTSGTPFEPVVILTGGVGHKIIDLHINRPEQDYVGIFGYSIAEITIEGVGLVNPTIVGHNYVGAFGGMLASSSPYLFRTYTNGGSVTGNNYVGGLVGAGETLAIEESFSSSIVTGSSNVGGVVATFLGEINSTTDVYYDSERSEQSDTGKGAPQTHTEMLTLSTYGGFDFDTVWGMDDGVTYPYLGTAEVAATFTPPVLQDGTEEHPFLISTCTELQNINNDLSAYYRLEQNIDCSDTVSWNSGLGFDSIGDESNVFHGTLDGDNYEIQNLFIDRPSEPAGLFEILGSAHIYDLKILNADITGNFAGILASSATLNFPSIQNNIISNVIVEGSVSGGSLIGGIFGETRNSIISDSSAHVNIIGPDASAEYFGGITGSLQDGDIVRSFATGTITTNLGTRVGGITGYSLNGSIYNTYSSVDIMGTENTVGGLVGWLDTSDLENSYAKGIVSGEGGGLVGVTYNSSITSSYYDSQTSGKSDTGKGTPKTTSEMKVSTTFSNWDFDSVWGIEQTETYPYLNDPGTNGQIPQTGNRPRAARSGSSGSITSPVITGEAQTTSNSSIKSGSGVTIEQAKQALLAITQSFNRNLSLRFEGDDVKKLQYLLISKNTGPAALELAQVGATGYFGNLTQQAVIEFQKAHNIVPALGFVGPLTRAKISELLNIEFVEVYIKLGSTGSEVKHIQGLLISKNTGPSAQELAKVGATGYFGNLTQQALIEFQKANQITGEDGYVGPKTKEVLK